MPKVKKDRAVKVELIPPPVGREKTSEPYQVLAAVRKEHHPHLDSCHILLYWRRGLKPDKGGHLLLGKAHVATDTERELQEHEFTITLNREAWDEFSPAQKAALIDHELSHCRVELNDAGEIVTDEKGRPVCRMKKHDLEEFRGVVERHGLYLDDLKAFALSVMAAKAKESEESSQPTLFNEGEGAA